MESRGGKGIAPGWLIERFDPLVSSANGGLAGKGTARRGVTGEGRTRRGCIDFMRFQPTRSPLGMRLQRVSDRETEAGARACRDSGRGRKWPHRRRDGSGRRRRFARGRGQAAGARLRGRAGRIIAAIRIGAARADGTAARAGGVERWKRGCSIRAERGGAARLAGKADLCWSMRNAGGREPGGGNPGDALASQAGAAERRRRCSRDADGRDLLKPGGRLVYAVCSLMGEEGAGPGRGLGELSDGSEALPIGGREAGAGRLLSPGRDGTDGFFVARWRSPC